MEIKRTEAATTHISPQFQPSRTPQSSGPATPEQKAARYTAAAGVALVIGFGVLGLLGAALYGAVTGLIAGWLQRLIRVRGQHGGRLVAALVTSEFWGSAPGATAVHVMIHMIAGIVAGSIIASLGFSVGAGVIPGLLFGGSGPPPPFVIGAVIVIAVVVAIICVLIVNPLIAMFLLKHGTQGAAAHMMHELFLHLTSGETAHRDFRSRLLRASVTEGALAGVLIGLLMTIFGIGH